MWIAIAAGIVAAVFLVVLFYCMAVAAGRADREIDSWAARRREGEQL